MAYRSDDRPPLGRPRDIHPLRQYGQLRFATQARCIEGGVVCVPGIHSVLASFPVAAFGLGGTVVDVPKEVVFRRAPFGLDAAEQMIRSTKGAPLLLEAHRRKTADVKALAYTLSRLPAFAVGAVIEGAVVRLLPLQRDFDGLARYV